MNFLYITFGTNAAIHAQAVFSLLSLIRDKAPGDTFHIVTDAPEYYGALSDQLRIHHVTAEKLNEWKGPYHFFWRIKIKALEFIAKENPGQAVIYLDTDTFLFAPLSTLRTLIQSGKAVMHRREGPLGNARSKTEKKMWQQVKGRSFGNITIMDDEPMYNAGVVASPNSTEGKEFDAALAACDEMCAAGVTPRLIEQFALSISLNHYYGLESADNVIAHYWSNKEQWDVLIASFLTEAWCKSWSVSDMSSRMQEMDLSRIPVTRRTKKTAKRLHKLVDYFLKPKEVAFLPKKR